MRDELSPAFLEAEGRVLAYMDSAGILTALRGGVLVALSGGADSVFLLYLLDRLSKKEGFPLRTVHIHHHLRGEEADRDAAFCEELAEGLALPHATVHIDPHAGGTLEGGLEAVCRRLRYAALREELLSSGLRVIATAHHATDQLETVLHRMLRGGGLRALVGIRPMYGDLVRPLLSLTKREIREALLSSGIRFVTDSTNLDKALTRNYLRAEVLPRLAHVVPQPERAVLRMTEALSHDAALLDELAEEALSAAPREGKGISAEYLRSLPEALRRRLLVLLYEEAREAAASEIAIEHTHVVTLSRLLLSGRGRFSLAVPNHLFGRLSGGLFSFVRLPGRIAEVESREIPLQMGENRLPGDFTLTLTREGETLFARCSSILNKIDTKAAISSAIINGGLYARPRREGDAYFFRGHTHSLKKLYNEKKIPIDLRATLPLLCDGDGILWMPFCPVRERSTGKPE